MLELIAVVMIVLWGVGMISSYTMGGFIHLLLVVAVIVILVRLIKGRGL
jgi:type IV secretory pathway VirB2 component (pilin)